MKPRVNKQFPSYLAFCIGVAIGKSYRAVVQVKFGDRITTHWVDL